MMQSTWDPGIERQIGEWKSFLLRRRTIHELDVDELEDHLRSEMSELGAAGLSGDESFLVAIKRLGGVNELSREFARERSSRLWKQLVLTGEQERSLADYLDLFVALGFAVAAAAAFKLPALFGVNPFDESSSTAAGPGTDEAFYLRNAALLTLPFLVGFLAWKRNLPLRVTAAIGVPFALGAILINTLPFERDGDTLALAAIHLPIALWLTAGVAYLGGAWRRDAPRMDFIRFTGEWFIYYTLIALGGGVLCALTLGVFAAIDLDVEPVIAEWVLPCGAVGAIVVVAWLVEEKQSVIENMAPVLTSVFTPLFAGMLLVAIAAMAVTGNVFDSDREFLILLDVLLVVVVGLVLYSISARDSDASPSLMDAIQLVLVAAALIIDVVALGAIVGRISEFGWTPNRTAGLGLNVVLLANLAWSAWLLFSFLRGRTGFAALERWQTRYVPVYAAWAVVVVVAFPVMFGFE